MSSNQKRFAPHVIAVTQGTVVSFPNQDKVFHNVFSRTTGSEFDLGLYRNGASRSVRFSKPGLVRVYCNIHPDMAGYVRVLEDGVFTTTDDKGAFRLAGIPPGRRVVQVWDERGGEKQFPLELEAGRSRTLNVVLDGTAFRRLPHKNKFGRTIRPSRKMSIATEPGPERSTARTAQSSYSTTAAHRLAELPSVVEPSARAASASRPACSWAPPRSSC